ncbi:MULTISPECIES: TetR/AcrR family transcriptional regulator [Saccharopolyspora]|uniref:TetR/AcrR family transcriptional regulator n=2 Tax=Saccharopolyspora TaxID=1835 RepID=A0A4R4VMI6_9PSEU|nr:MULTISPECIES: TetR family transcriptional regulator [Saccharopolyspora]MBQ0925769.1 TetR family transcriptional regulator [Saccharopolyspora endophytica]TDD07019.1 TetR/AcrR family transcriptional regulator [Saccharopolyspora terrae]
MARRSGSQTREAIRDAATRLFTEHGYADTSVRDIASLAATDPALVIRHFGSKELLFLDTMHLSIDDEPLLNVPLERLGSRFVEVLLDSDSRSRAIYLAMVQGSGNPQIAARLRETHETSFVQPLRVRMRGPDAEDRARSAAALVGGLLYALWVVGDQQLAADRAGLVERYGELLQRLLTP